MTYARLSSLILLTLAGCVAPSQPREVAPAPVVTPAPPRPTPVPLPLASDWNDWPFTPGDWSYRRSDQGTLAMFGTAQIVLRCDFARRTVLLRVDGAVGSVTVRTTTATRSIAVATSVNAATDGGAMLPANDTLLDAMAFSRGRIVIERAGKPPIVAPPQGEIGRVIEDCRG